MGIQQLARLGKSDLAELNRRLEDIATFLVEQDDPDEERFISVTL